MQQLYMMQTFRNTILSIDDNQNPNSLSIQKYSPKDDNLLHQLQVMHTYLTLSEKQYFSPTYFCNSFKDSDGNPINVKIQQDSQEFYNNFCQKIEGHLKNTKFK